MDAGGCRELRALRAGGDDGLRSACVDLAARRQTRDSTYGGARGMWRAAGNLKQLQSDYRHADAPPAGGQRRRTRLLGGERKEGGASGATA